MFFELFLTINCVVSASWGILKRLWNINWFLREFWDKYANQVLNLLKNYFSESLKALINLNESWLSNLEHVTLISWNYNLIVVPNIECFEVYAS